MHGEITIILSSSVYYSLIVPINGSYNEAMA